MILYGLVCDAAHRFESWFADSAAFERQALSGHVNCPVCGSHEVAKAIMAPAVVGTRAPRGEAKKVALVNDAASELRALMREFRAKVLAEAEDVGARFPEEARRIHDGDSPDRRIHGRATAEEARDLLDEGILILPVPAGPEELN